jgi:hypothetical protein
MNSIKIKEELRKVNRNRKIRIVTLDYIIAACDNIINNYKGNKKNIRYLEISNKISVAKSYTWKVYYTKWHATLTEKGKIKKLEIEEEECTKTPFGVNEININVSIENIEKITGCDLKNASKKAIKVLENAILEGLC